MNWDAIGAIGEIIGALAVVITLAYLAIQIRQNTKVAQASTRQGVTNSAMEGGKFIAECPDIAVFLQKLNSGEELEPHELMRLNALAYFSTRNWENIHYQYLQGMLTENEWAAFRKNLKILYQGKLWQDYWDREKEIYTDIFKKEIEALLKEIAVGETVGDKSTLFISK